MTFTKEQQLILLGIIASIIIGLGVTTYKYFFDNKLAIDKPLPHNLPPSKTTVTVHICGAVAREGVYKLKTGDRWLEAINLAGGAQPAADLSAINLAEMTKDGSKIEVPFKRMAQPVTPQRPESVLASSQAKNKTEKPNPVININTASEPALDSLPGVGPSTAKAIVEYRQTKGRFARIEQIMEIPRFGKSKFEKIKNLIII